MDAAEMRAHVAAANAKIEEGQGAANAVQDALDELIGSLHRAQDQFSEATGYYAAISENPRILDAVASANNGQELLGEVILAFNAAKEKIDEVNSAGNLAIEHANSYADQL